MKQMIPYEKLSKKEKRKRDLERRGSWGGINPVTRRPENPKAYRREKERSWKKSGSVLFMFGFCGVTLRQTPRYPAQSSALRPSG